MILRDNSFFAGCLVCQLNSPLWGLGGFCADGAVQSPSTHFFCFVLGWPVYHHKGDSCYLRWGSLFYLFHLTTVATSFGGIGQDTLASNKFMEADMVLDNGMSTLLCGSMAVTAASGCCSSWGLLPLGVEGPSSSWNFLVGQGIPLSLL